MIYVPLLFTLYKNNIMTKIRYISVITITFFLSLFSNLLVAQSESSVDKQLFEITRVGHIKTGKKKLNLKSKRLKIKIRSNYDMGNSTIVVVLNGKKVTHEMKETGTESVGSKVKVVTGVKYDIIIKCLGLLKSGENEVLIKGYGIPQKRMFKVRN